MSVFVVIVVRAVLYLCTLFYYYFINKIAFLFSFFLCPQICVVSNVGGWKSAKNRRARKTSAKQPKNVRKKPFFFYRQTIPRTFTRTPSAKALLASRIPFCL